MQLIWHGTLLFGFHPSVIFLGKTSLLTLHKLLMMRAAILGGVHRGLLSLVSVMEICLLITCSGESVRNHRTMLLHV
ncbi:hypothetical protein SLEP1_g34464 [Rubroshorea leprosula]|uniref:Uncharacterized protein n=1 Tax=Rubroshorea leprosula TaxID=152421 RepID=A0AAV5KKB5_9ROSI|nr:hypothetical protein SLEP1_g34464 [Rubroshorea leprosula]